MIIDLIIIAVVLLICIEAYRWSEYPSATAIVIVLYAVYVYGGAVYLYYLYDIKDWDLSRQFDATVNLIRVGFFSLLSACVLANFIIPRTGIPNKPVDLHSGESEKKAVDVFAGFSLIIGLLYLYAAPALPIQYLFTDSELLATAREEVTTKYRYYNFFSNFIYGYIPIIAAYYYFKGNRTSFLVYFALAFILSISTGQKSPLVYLTILLILMVSLKKRKIFYLRYVLLFIVILILLFGFAYLENGYILGQAESESIQAVSNALFLRIFGGAQTLIGYVEYFTTYRFFAADAADAPTDQIIYRYMNPDSPITGSANAVFLGNLFASLDSLLVIGIVSMFIFFLVFCIDNYWFNKMTSPLHYAFYVFFAMSSMKFAATDFRTAFFNFYYPILSFYGFVLFFSSIKTRGIIDSRPFHKAFSYLALFVFLYVLQGQIKSFIISQ